MTIANLPPIILDIDPILRRCDLPYWALARFRALKVDESYLLADFDGPGLCDGAGNAGVSLTRGRRGVFHLEAGWMLHIGANARRRGHLWSWVDFKLLPGRKIELVQKAGRDTDVRMLAFRQVEKVLRRAALLARKAKAEGEKAAYAAITPARFMSRAESELGAAEWLEKLRGPALTRSVYPALQAGE